MPAELLERIREVVMVDTAVVLMVEGADAAPVLGAAAGTDVQVDATVELARREKVARRVIDERREIELGGARANNGTRRVAKPSAR